MITPSQEVGHLSPLGVGVCRIELQGRDSLFLVTGGVVMSISCIELSKQDIANWACEQSNRELEKRIDVLISVVLSGVEPSVVSEAKFESSELAKIMLRRRGS